MTKKTFTVWITKNALSIGIEKAQATPTEFLGMIYVSKNIHIRNYFHGNDWHKTPEEAEKRAEEIRAKKLKSLHAQIKALNKLDLVAPRD